MTTAGRPRALRTATSRSSTDSARAWRTSSNSCSGNCASSAWTRRAAVSPVESETMCSSTGGAATARSVPSLPVATAGGRDDTRGMAVAGAELVAQEFVEARAAEDWQRLEACFAPDARLLAAVPNDANPLRDRVGAADAAAQLAAWFGDGDPLELESSTVEQIGGKVHLAYHFRSFE